MSPDLGRFLDTIGSRIIGRVSEREIQGLYQMVYSLMNDPRIAINVGPDEPLLAIASKKGIKLIHSAHDRHDTWFTLGLQTRYFESGRERAPGLTVSTKSDCFEENKHSWRDIPLGSVFEVSLAGLRERFIVSNSRTEAGLKPKPTDPPSLDARSFHKYKQLLENAAFKSRLEYYPL